VLNLTSRQEHSHDRPSHQPVAPALEDMTIRKFAPKTQASYIRAVRNFTIFLGRSPGQTGAENLRRCQLHRKHPSRAAGCGVRARRQVATMARVQAAAVAAGVSLSRFHSQGRSSCRRFSDRADAREDVGQPGLGIDLVEPGRHDDGKHDGDPYRDLNLRTAMSFFRVLGCAALAPPHFAWICVWPRASI
jgi:hypothetical protein